MAAFKKQTLVDYTAVDAQKATAVQKQLLQAYESNGFFAESVIKTLEAYLAEQLANGSVDIDADLALLKLYLVYPAAADVEKIASVLVQAVSVLPSSFFSGASAIVPESFREDANVKQILSAGFLLQSCRFEEFWKVDVSFATKVSSGFTETVRAYILDSLRKSHSVISSAVLAASLNVADKEVAAIVAAESWTQANELITITANDDNQVRPKKIQETIEFEDVLKAVHTLSR